MIATIAGALLGTFFVAALAWTWGVLGYMMFSIAGEARDRYGFTFAHFTWPMLFLGSIALVGSGLIIVGGVSALSIIWTVR